MFSQQDFQEHSTRLSVVTMGKVSKPTLTSFRVLTKGDKVKFSKLLSEYTYSLPQESWKDNLVSDFSPITEEKLPSESLDPSKLHIPILSSETQSLSKEK